MDVRGLGERCDFFLVNFQAKRGTWGLSPLGTVCTGTLSRQGRVSPQREVASPVCLEVAEAKARQGNCLMLPHYGHVKSSVCRQGAPTSNAEEAEVERFYEDLQDLLEPTPKGRRERS